MHAQWDLGSHWKNGTAPEVLIAIMRLWFPSRLGVGCHAVNIPRSNPVSFSPWPPVPSQLSSSQNSEHGDCDDFNPKWQVLVEPGQEGVA